MTVFLMKDSPFKKISEEDSSQFVIDGRSDLIAVLNIHLLMRVLPPRI